MPIIDDVSKKFKIKLKREIIATYTTLVTEDQEAAQDEANWPSNVPGAAKEMHRQDQDGQSKPWVQGEWFSVVA